MLPTVIDVVEDRPIIPPQPNRGSDKIFRGPSECGSFITKFAYMMLVAPSMDGTRGLEFPLEMGGTSAFKELLW